MKYPSGFLRTTVAGNPKIQPFQYEDGDTGYWNLYDYAFEMVDGILTIKAGFDFDGASIPRWLWSLIGHPVEPTILPGALPHDGLYCTHAFSKARTDQLFLDVMAAFDRGRINRKLCYGAVETAGRFVWPKTPEEIAKYKEFVIWEPFVLSVASASSMDDQPLTPKANP